MASKRGAPGASVFLVLALTLLGATLIPLAASLLLWRFEYAGNSNKSLGLAQIRNALDGSARLLEIYRPERGGYVDSASLALIKRLLNGPIVKITIGPSSQAEARSVIGRFLGANELDFIGDAIIDTSGVACGFRRPDGSWAITAPRWVEDGAAKWDGLDEAGRRSIANEPIYIRVSRDPRLAVIQLGATGYVWAITAATEPGTPCFEYFHPQIEAVDVAFLENAQGEHIGAEIASLRGALKPGASGEDVRYDYFWKNPEESRERKKIVLIRYIEPWNIVLCAGLYDDEYFLPAKAAESMFVMLVLLIVFITLAMSFLFAGRISRALRSLADFSRLTAESDGAVHSLARTGLREFDMLGASMSDMEMKILSRERTLKKELDEKTALVEEVHHRVKNNLAVLAGIINLQKDLVEGAEAGETLSLLYGRVNSMGLVYQQLVGTGEYSEVPFDEYVLGILSYYQSALDRGSPAIARSERLERVAIKLKVAVPFGLVVNELIANVYRHGISSARVPEISVELRMDGDDCEFSVYDNGDGMGPAMKERTGYLLIRALCSQMRATISVMSPAGAEGGTRVSILVPL